MHILSNQMCEKCPPVRASSADQDAIVRIAARVRAREIAARVRACWRSESRGCGDIVAGVAFLKVER